MDVKSLTLFTNIIQNNKQMKKLFTLLTLALCSIGVSAQITAKVWDFTAPTAADLTALRGNTDNFTDDTSNEYIKNKNDVAQGSITLALEGANGTDISVADGLLFGRTSGGKLSGGSLRYYYKNSDYYIYFNNSNCTVKLPSIAAGKEVVITSKDYSGDLTLTNGEDISSKAGEQKFTVPADGDVTITFKSKMANLQKIEVRTKVVDTTAPTLSSTVPAANAVNVLLSGNIVLSFDETVKKVGENITATLNGSNITGTANGTTVTFAYDGLSTNTAYTFSLPANQVSDVAGNNYASAININFTTIDQSVVWPFKATALDQEANVYISPASDIASYIIQKGSNVRDFAVDAVKGTYAYVNSTNDNYDDNTYIYFSVTPADGKAFVPTAVEFEASKVGSDNPRIQAYWVNADGTEKAIGSEINPVRDAPALVSIPVSGVSLGSAACGLKLKYKGGSSNKGIGLWNIKLIGTVETVPANVSAAVNSTYGWSTFVSPYALDFTGLSEIKAYIVTNRNDYTIVTTQMTGTVPAGIPLLLEGATTNVPVAASSTTDVSANKLKAGDGTAVSPEASIKTKYALSVEGGVATFKKITSDTTIPTGKAYLEFNEVINAPELTFDFGGTTGIDVIRKQAVSGEVYNLNGQRVAQPTKSLYIVNGKKVVLK